MQLQGKCIPAALCPNYSNEQMQTKKRHVLLEISHIFQPQNEEIVIETDN